MFSFAKIANPLLYYVLTTKMCTINFHPRLELYKAAVNTDTAF